MSAVDRIETGQVLLISAPWPLFNRPSLPLGALQAYLADRLPSVQVDTCHLFLHLAHELGFGRYQRVSHRAWRAESIFSALLYPQRAHLAESLYYGTFKKRSEDPPADFKQLLVIIETAIDTWLHQIDWSRLDLVGLSISFCQVTASLYLISRIKAIRPSLPVVVGGSSFSGERSGQLLEAFPLIDYLIVGEGERPLAGLIRALLEPAPRGREGDALYDGVIHRRNHDVGQRRHTQLERLDNLPAPHYDDYFNLLTSFEPQRRFFPVLPVEASRGCWWHGRSADGQFSGCAFCNLNLQWQGYRTKSVDQVLREVDYLVERHQTLSLAFSDNAIALKQADTLFDGIRKQGRDLSIFAELRANAPPSLVKKMKRAGVDTVQIGVEALSDRLLLKMNKGARVIDNLCLMKYCEALGIDNASNLILHFPGSDEADIQETLRAVPFARWYRPLKPVSFWLGLGSPVYRFKNAFGIRSVYNHPNVKQLFPQSVAAKIRFMIQSYHGDRNRQKRLWRPVKDAVRNWQIGYETMQQQTRGMPALAYRDGGRFLIIDQHRPGKSAERHRLTGASADIYRFCSTPRRAGQIADRFQNHRPEQIRDFLASMVAKHLVFEADDWYLSLAAPASWRDP